MLSKLRYFSRPVVVSIICVYALYLRLMKLACHELWTDEIFYLSPMKGTFLGFLKAIPKFQFCSYLSGDLFLFYPFFKIFSYNKWGLAIPSIIATIAGFYILYLICKRYFKTIWGYIITFSVVCLNATLINHATEIRTYSVLPTLALAVFYLSQVLVEQNVSMSIKKKWAIGFFFVFAIWFHVYGIVMLLVSIAFALLEKFRDRSFGTILKDTAKFLSFVLLIAMPLWLYSVFGPHVEWRHLNLNTFKYIPNPLKDIIGFLKGIFGNLVGYKKFYFLLIAVFFPWFVFYKGRLKQILFLGITVFLPLGMMLLSNVMQQYWFLQRQFIWVMPWFAFFLGWSWDSFINYINEKFRLRKE